MAVATRLNTSALKGFQQSIRGGSLMLFSGIMLANVVAYAYQMIMARMMVPEDYGVLVTLTSVSYVLAVMMRTIQAWVIKTVSTDSAVAKGLVHSAFIVSMRLIVPLGAVVFLGLWLASGWIAGFLRMDSATPVIMLGVYTVTSLLVPIPRGMLLGLNRWYSGSIVHVLEPAVRLAAGAVLVVAGLRVNGALGGFAIGNLAAFGFALIPLWPLLFGRKRGVGPQSIGGPDRYAFFILLVNTCLMVMASVDQIAVKRYFSDELAGNYAVAFLLGRVISMSTIALGWAVFSRSATMSSQDMGRARVLLKAIVVVALISGVLMAGYLLAPSLVVRWMSGSQYVVADEYVGLIGIEMMLFSLTYIQAYYLISVRKIQVVWPLAVATVLELVLLALYHETIQQILLNLILVMAGLLVCVSILSWRTLRSGSSKRSIGVESSSGSASAM